MKLLTYYAIIAYVVLGQLFTNGCATFLTIAISVRAAGSDNGLAAEELGVLVFWRFIAALVLVPILPRLIHHFSLLPLLTVVHIFSGSFLFPLAWILPVNSFSFKVLYCALGTSLSFIFVLLKTIQSRYIKPQHVVQVEAALRVSGNVGQLLVSYTSSFVTIVQPLESTEEHARVNQMFDFGRFDHHFDVSPGYCAMVLVLVFFMMLLGLMLTVLHVQDIDSDVAQDNATHVPPKQAQDVSQLEKNNTRAKLDGAQQVTVVSDQNSGASWIAKQLGLSKITVIICCVQVVPAIAITLSRTVNAHFLMQGLGVSSQTFGFLSTFGNVSSIVALSFAMVGLQRPHQTKEPAEQTKQQLLDRTIQYLKIFYGLVLLEYTMLLASAVLSNKWLAIVSTFLIQVTSNTAQLPAQTFIAVLPGKSSQEQCQRHSFQKTVSSFQKAAVSAMYSWAIGTSEQYSFGITVFVAWAIVAQFPFWSIPRSQLVSKSVKVE